MSGKAAYLAYAFEQASLAHISPALTIAVIDCESGGTWNPTIVGDHGHSHGLAQIYDTYHPDISRAQADDPRFAIDYLTENIKEGRGRMWTCYRRLTR